MIISPIPRGLTEQLKIIPLSLVFLNSNQYVEEGNLRASLLVIYSVTAYLLVSSNLNITALPFLLRALAIATLSLLPAMVICMVWVVRYKIELDFLHNISKVITLSTVLLLLPPFPGTTNVVDSMMVIQYIIFIYSILTAIDNIVVSRLFRIDGWNLSLQGSALYHWIVLSAARCFLQSVCLSLCSLYFAKFQYTSTSNQSTRLKRFPVYRKVHTLAIERFIIAPTHGNIGKQTDVCDLLYTGLILILSGRIWYSTVWKGSAITKYSPKYYGMRELISLCLSQKMTFAILTFNKLIQHLLCLLIFLTVGWLYFHSYRTKITTLKVLNIPEDLNQAFCRKGFHVLYAIVLLSLLSDPVIFFVLSSAAVCCFCVLEAVRGQVQTPFHTYTQRFVTDTRSNVELSHILLLLSGSAFPAIYFLFWLAPGPPTHVPETSGDACHSSNAWCKTLHFIYARNTKMQMYDSFLSAGIVTTICADACAVYAPIIFTYITGSSPHRYKDVCHIKFKSNLIVVSTSSEKNYLKTKNSIHKNYHFSHQYTNSIPINLISTKTTYNGPSLFSRGCHNACLNKNRTFVGSVGFCVSSTLICILLYGYPIVQSLVLSIVTAIAEAVSSIDNLILPFIFICFRGIMYYLL